MPLGGSYKPVKEQTRAQVRATAWGGVAMLALLVGGGFYFLWHDKRFSFEAVACFVCASFVLAISLPSALELRRRGHLRSVAPSITRSRVGILLLLAAGTGLLGGHVRYGPHTDRAVWCFWSLLAVSFAWAFLLYRRERQLAWLCWLYWLCWLILLALIPLGLTE